MTDEYRAAGEIHDLFMTQPWERLAPGLATAFSSLDTDAVVLDLGAGSGIGTRTLARATRARIIAVEPSLTMRAALLARIADDERLAERVSVLAGSAPGILDEIDGPIDGFVCAHMLGHLSADDRAATLAGLAQLLRPIGVGFVTLPPAEEVTLDPGAELVEQRRIGQHVYRARRTLDTETGRVREEYAVLDGERVLRATTGVSSWSLPPRAEFIDELGRAGLAVERIDGGAAILRRADTLERAA